MSVSSNLQYIIKGPDHPVACVIDMRKYLVPSDRRAPWKKNTAR